MRLKRTGILTKIIIVVLLVYGVVTLMRLHSQIDTAEAAKLELEQQVADITAENEDMQYAIDNSEDEGVIRDIARDKLGLVEPGEEVYYAG
ncbi:MAG: septum formation initiator family protein [Oscillospiraceae bacterium]